MQKNALKTGNSINWSVFSATMHSSKQLKIGMDGDIVQ